MSIVFVLTVTCALLFATRVCVGTWITWSQRAADEWNAEWQRRSDLLRDLDPLTASRRTR